MVSPETGAAIGRPTWPERLKALSGGADGVLITGCHPGECHYIEQNYKAMRRYLLLRRTLAQMGIEPGRVKLVWASAAEGVKLAKEISTLVEEIRALGPLNWPGRVKMATGGNGTAVSAHIIEEVTA